MIVVAIGATLTATPAGAQPGCNTRSCEHRVQARWLRQHYQHIWRSAPLTVRAHLRRIARCESHGDPRAISPSGLYRGRYQFAMTTWRTVGGRGDPARASGLEQDARAARLYRMAGPGQWPVCQWR